MDQSVVLWIGGVVFAVIGVLVKITLDRILKTQDDQGRALGKQGELLARIDGTLHGENGLASGFRELRERTQKHGETLCVVEGEAEVLLVRVERLEEERRSGEDRREQDRGTGDRRRA